MKLKVIIRKGDITTSENDVIVNAANTNLWMGAGVAGAIKRAGGKVIEDEAIAKGPIEIGSAIEEFIRDATSNTLQLCEKLKIKSVSFPAFGTGVGGFSREKCAQIMLSVILNFKPSYLEEVHFYLFDEETKNIFESTYQNFMPS
jgi:O-acetyl-ADP-ribose deacetylase (regulator of RNase III)